MSRFSPSRLSDCAFRYSVLFIVVLGLFPFPFNYAFAQSGRTLRGVVVDTLDEGLSDASVDLHSAGTVLHTIPDRNGKFEFPNLPAGEYEIVVNRRGFSQSMTKGIQIGDKDPDRVKIVLRPGPISNCCYDPVVPYPEKKLEEGNRYFKEDHLTGADYLALAPDGSYTVTGREHMGIWVIESGRWSRADMHITFTPDKPGKSPYHGTEIVYRGHTFLSWEDEENPTIVVPIGDTKQSLEETPESLPPYVFFQINAKRYQQEVKETYPFRTGQKVD